MTTTLTSQAGQQQAIVDQFGLADRVVNPDVLAHSVQRFRERGIVLPTFEELAAPPTHIAKDAAGDADPQGADARNLWRVHWYNDAAGNQIDVPEHVVLTKELTGIDSPILVLFGNRFPMITAHKVLAAYACDLVSAVSDAATDSLEVMVNEPAGVDLLRAKGVPEEILTALPDFGLSSFCNVLAAISCAKVLNLGADDVIVTVATDGGQMYASERAKVLDRDFGGEFTAQDAAEVWGRCLADVPTGGTLELTEFDKDRIFNLGYYTWVEQQGTPLELFEARRSQDFWTGLHRYLPIWNEMIRDFNAQVAAG